MEESCVVFHSYRSARISPLSSPLLSSSRPLPDPEFCRADLVSTPSKEFVIKNLSPALEERFSIDFSAEGGEKRWKWVFHDFESR